jgi:hypothetical protein
MTLFICWVVFPLVLTVLSIGCGLLLDGLTGGRLPGALLAPVGLAVMIVVGSFTTMSSATAQLTVPVVVALAVGGLALSFPWGGRRVGGWAIAAAVVVFAAYAAPVVLTGHATFAGYIQLDDTSTWLAMTDRLMEHGRSLSGLPPSTYEATLANYLAVGSPIGANLPLGIGGKLVGTDIIWLFQPYLAFLGAMLALTLFTLARRVVGARPVSAVVAVIASPAALLYGYSLWGGMKEVAAAVLIPLTAALVAPLVEATDDRVRRAVPAAVAGGAMISVLTVGGATWLAALLLPACAVALWARRRAFVLSAAAFVAGVVVLSLPSLLTTAVFFRHVTDNSVLTSGAELGNLIRPLSWLQLFGIWPIGDFRVTPGSTALTYLLIAVTVAAALLGLVYAWTRRAWGLVLYPAAIVLGCLAIAVRGSPWVVAKALATGSPAFLAVGLAGLAWVFQGGRRVEAVVAAVAIASGVVWSDALLYHDAWLAPRTQLAELETIGNRFAGEGPALMTEYQPYGVRHLLRRLDPEGAGELRRRVDRLRNGRLVSKGGYADIDELELGAVLDYRTLVLLRSPSASRPPSVYTLAWSGRFYQVWQRPDAYAPIAEHLSLGGGLQAAAVTSCSTISRLAELAGPSGRLAAVIRPPATVVSLAEASRPSAWTSWSGAPGAVYPYGNGTLQTTVSVSRPGRYGVWLGGSFRRLLQVSIDGKPLGRVRDQLNHPGEDTPFGTLVLGAGTHRIAIVYRSTAWRPGDGGTPFAVGPLVLDRTAADVPVKYVPSSRASTLCGKRLDWVEALQG